MYLAYLRDTSSDQRSLRVRGSRVAYLATLYILCSMTNRKIMGIFFR